MFTKLFIHEQNHPNNCQSFLSIGTLMEELKGRRLPIHVVIYIYMYWIKQVYFVPLEPYKLKHTERVGFSTVLLAKDAHYIRFVRFHWYRQGKSDNHPWTVNLPAIHCTDTAKSLGLYPLGLTPTCSIKNDRSTSQLKWGRFKMAAYT